MHISSTYICPVRGLTGLEAPDSARLGETAKAAKGLHVERLLVPVLEESLLGPSRTTVDFLDRLLKALDRLTEADLTAWVILPARRLMGLDWVPPYLVRPVSDAKSRAVFLEGRVRTLRPFDWWSDLSVMQKRIRLFREVVAAISGHPALTGWVIMDRALEWPRPDLETAEWVLRSHVAEIRERDEKGSIFLGVGWQELLDPEMVHALTAHVDGLRISGLDDPTSELARTSSGLEAELAMAAYMGVLFQWLFEKPTEAEIGWGLMEKTKNPEAIEEACKLFPGHAVFGASWVTLVDPANDIRNRPPWSLRRGLKEAGLFDRNLEPKEHVETWLEDLGSGDRCDRDDRIGDFIYIGRKEYLSDPYTHMARLWDHFRESI
jgi:hypothetical protein